MSMKHTLRTAEQSIPRISLTWLLIAQALVIAPHLFHVPLWLIGLWLGCAAGRGQVFRMRAPFPNTWVKALLMLARAAQFSEAWKEEKEFLGTFTETSDGNIKYYSMEGADDLRPTMSVEDIERICRNAGFRAVERDTHYNEL